MNPGLYNFTILAIAVMRRGIDSVEDRAISSLTTTSVLILALAHIPDQGLHRHIAVVLARMVRAIGRPDNIHGVSGRVFLHESSNELEFHYRGTLLIQ
jgi:hypothetical protein